MEWLRTILEKAVIADGKLDVEATMKSVTAEFPKHAVPKTEFNNKVTELDAANTTIKDLKKDNGDNETLQATIKSHEDTIKTMKADYQKELSGIKMDSAINKLLSENHAKYPDLLASKFDRTKLQVQEDGQIIGLTDQFKTVKESYKDMFSQTVAGKTPANPDTKSKDTTAFETLVNNADTMTAEEVAEQFAAMEK